MKKIVAASAVLLISLTACSSPVTKDGYYETMQRDWGMNKDAADRGMNAICEVGSDDEALVKRYLAAVEAGGGEVAINRVKAIAEYTPAFCPSSADLLTNMHIGTGNIVQ